MSLSLMTRTQAAARTTMRTGWVWSVVDEKDHAARVEYLAGSCPSLFIGTIGTKRQPENPWRALAA